ncbi:hypothetical protein [Streptomyces sp. SID3343]|uniref:hypothetical protein n=1 Tax=Streptomyces sp. SID3343 TaxID=2690260 RepID=UPI0013700BC0|nr:hypothetical protein [Streptomyces sp. SID3343]MYW05684.1 hypothetical protein [Streptomyces sp. SID3343]
MRRSNSPGSNAGRDRSKRLFATAAVAVIAAATAGCAGEGNNRVDKASGSSASPGPRHVRSAAVSFTTCMRERGYDLKDPQFDDQGLPRIDEQGKRGEPQYEKARQECRKPLDAAVQAQGVQGKNTADLLPFTRCMREHGVDIADPTPEQGNALRLDKQTMNSPAWKTSLDACRGQLPPAYSGMFDNVGAK